jgi:hypothetical protein
MAFAMQDGAPVAALSHAELLADAAGMGEECALHMQIAAAHDSDNAAAAPAHKGCQSCQLCMPLAALASVVVLASAANPQTLPLSHSSCFVSADPAHDVKPPIS